MSKTLSPLRKKKRRRRRVVAPKPLNPDMEIKPETATVAVLTDAYALGVGWDNEEDAFLAELSDFGVQVHDPTRLGATALALEAQRLLIETYRAKGYELPAL